MKNMSICAAVRTYRTCVSPSFQTNENGRGLLAWRQQQQMLQRIYGTAWADKKALNAYRSAWKKPRNATTVKSVNSSTVPYAGRSTGYGLLAQRWLDHFRELEVFVRSKLKEYQYQEVKVRS